MPDVQTAPTATADQTRAAGSRMLGYYLGVGDVKVDVLFDVANFLTKNAAGEYLSNGPLVAGFTGAAATYNAGWYGRSPSGGTVDWDFKTKDTTYGARTAFTVTASANIGIGTTSPIGRLHINTSSTAESLVWAGNNLNGACVGMIGGNKPGVGAHSNNTFYIIGSAGSVPVDLAIFTPDGLGIGIAPQLPIHIARADQASARIRIQNTAVGGRTIDLVSGIHNVSQGDFSIYDATNAGTLFAFGVNYIRPGGDNSVSCGTSSYRFSEVRAVNGSIITSDEREKTWREVSIDDRAMHMPSCSTAEIAAARRIAAELGFYQWNDAIAEKADEARYHFGVRAQRVWAIMADEGLTDPVAEGETPTSSYAFLCYDEWPDETEIGYADVEVTKTRIVQCPSDIIDPATGEPALIEEEEEYVEIERQDTGERIVTREAGNRFGVRPDQLALFLIAAQEARLAALEAA